MTTAESYTFAPPYTGAHANRARVPALYPAIVNRTNYYSPGDQAFRDFNDGVLAVLLGVDDPGNGSPAYDQGRANGTVGVAVGM